MRMLAFYVLGSAAFVVTGGYLFREQFEKNPVLSFVVCLLLLAGTIQTIEWIAGKIGTASAVSSPTGRPQSPQPAPVAVSPPADEIFWLSIKDSAVAGLFEEFVQRFPRSTYVGEARARIAELTARSVVPRPEATGSFCVTVNQRRICE